MPRELWWASLNESSPRYADWFQILGTNRIPLLSCWSAEAKLGEETCEVYGLDWQALDQEQSDRLLGFLSKKFNADPKEIEGDLDRDGYMPIRASDVTVCYDLRAFL